MLDRLKNIKHLCLDLDGTLYLGQTLFEFTRPFLRQIAQLGIGRTFFTNNSSRSTRQYVEKLNKLGIDATERDLFSSTHCTLDYLSEHHSHAKSAFVLGTPALRGEFVENGFVERGDNASDRPDLVIVGFDVTLTYERLSRAAWWISKGVPFIATHPDRTCPTDEPTLLPDCGAICKLLSHATGREPDAVLGKPDPRMLAGVMLRHNLAAAQLGVVGDRLYTDMAMARGAGAIGVLVLTGETTEQQAHAARPQPDVIVHDVGKLGRLLATLKETTR